MKKEETREELEKEDLYWGYPGSEPSQYRRQRQGCPGAQ